MSGSIAAPIPGGALPSSGPAAPLIGGPIENDQTGTTQPTLSEALDADVKAGISSLPTVESFNSAGKLYPDQPYQAPPSDWGQLTDFPGGFVPSRPVQPMTAEDANKQAQAAGATLKPYAPGTTVDQPTFTAQLTDNLTEQKRQKVISDHATGILSGAVDFGMSALTSMLDPLNDMAMLVPGAPEAWTARAIEGMGGGLAARIAGRAGAGALQGAAGMAALQPLQAEQASQDQMDFSWGNALRQIAIGGAIGAVGGGIHGGLSVAPETAEAVAKGALARVMTDDPRGVDIQGLIDHADASQAANNLETWQRRQQAIDAARPPPATTDTLGRSVEINNARERMENAYEQERQLRGEIGQVPAVDPATQARLDAVQQELSGVIPSARRAELEQEREMLTGGRPEDAALETARSQAQRSGLTAAAERARATAQTAEESIVTLRASEAREQAAADARRNSSDRSTRIQQARLDSQEEVLQAMMEKEVRAYAYNSGVTLEPGEAATAAREIRTAQPGEVRDTIAGHIAAIAKRSDAFPVRDALAAPRLNTTPTPGLATLRREAQGAATDMAARALNPTDPELDRTTRNGANLIATQPKLEGIDVAKDSTEAGQMVADVKAAYDAAVARGDIAEHPSLADAGKDELARGDAEKAYLAACGFGAL